MKSLIEQLFPASSPRRLADAGSDAERLLLASAGQDGAPSAAAARMASALGAVLVDSPEVAAPAASGAAPESSLRLRLGRFGIGPAVGLALLGGVAGLWLWSHPAAPLASAGAPSPVLGEPAPANSAVALGAASAPPRTVAGGAPSLSSIEPQPQSGAPSATPSTPRALPRPRRAAAVAPPQGALAEEVRALDAIRSALNAGDAPRAARQLERYGQRFPRGELRLESELLAVDVALAQGQRERARARAEELLARPGSARYAEHLRRALDGSNARDVHIGERR